MDKKYRVGILGATGAVGQNYLKLLENHPWFEVTYLAASKNSAGKTYKEAVGEKWFMDSDIPINARKTIVEDANNLEAAIGRCDFLFSSFEGSKEDIQKIEIAYAERGFPVISNNSAHRWTDDVPMIIPEINYDDMEMIVKQRINREFNKGGGGFIVTKPNCSIQSYMIPIYALAEKGYYPRKIIVTTQQALSGAGYPGVPSLAIMNNVIPYIGGEEWKTEEEPFKIFAGVFPKKILDDLKISATCTRVPVIDGHTAIVSMEFGENIPSLEKIVDIWRNYRSLPQLLNLPSAPISPIIYREEEDRPQPRKDKDNGNGMAITVGRLRKCNVLDFKFVGLSHNTNRGAAGGAILTAELLAERGYIARWEGLHLL